MRKTAFALAILAPLTAQAKPMNYPITQFDGDRYVQIAAKKEPTRSDRRKRKPRWDRQYPVPGSVAPLRSFMGGFIRGRLICAVNVGAELAARGIRGTGSAKASSYLRWGHESGPVPGAVAVFKGGGRRDHVALVHSVQPNGQVIYLNPSSRRQAWQVGPYSRRPIAYRIAGG